MPIYYDAPAYYYKEQLYYPNQYQQTTSNKTLPSDLADIFNVFIVQNLAAITMGKSPFNIRYQAAFNELYHNYQSLRHNWGSSQKCLRRCHASYRRCLAYATNQQQRDLCRMLYLKCRQLCQM